MNSFPEQFDKIFIICNTYLEFSIKNKEIMLKGQCKKYVLVSSDMKIPHNMFKFLSFGAKKKRSLERILQSITNEKEKLGSCVTYFLNIETCTKMSSTTACLVDTLKSDHAEPGAKIVTLIANSNITTNKTVLVRSSSDDIGIICLSLLTIFHFKFCSLIMEQRQIGKFTALFHKTISSTLQSCPWATFFHKAQLIKTQLIKTQCIKFFFEKVKLLKQGKLISLFPNLRK